MKATHTDDQGNPYASMWVEHPVTVDDFGAVLATLAVRTAEPSDDPAMAAANVLLAVRDVKRATVESTIRTHYITHGANPRARSKLIGEDLPENVLTLAKARAVELFT